MRYLEKSYKSFSSRSTRPVNLRSGRRNSPGKALHFVESGVELQRPVHKISEITDTLTQTHT